MGLVKKIVFLTMEFAAALLLLWSSASAQEASQAVETPIGKLAIGGLKVVVAGHFTADSGLLPGISNGIRCISVLFFDCEIAIESWGYN